VAPEGVAGPAGAVPRRCLCLLGGPRGGRLSGGGGASAFAVAPEGVAGPAGAVPIAFALAPEGVAARAWRVPVPV
jgi:hypothetical protein